ncbi:MULTISPECIES: fimbrial protein [Klebsiella]|uniref:fimbrial protein n=1 Tax=Klebsiella TaxID=570 RepID=UPI00237B2CE7|nr:fimbrial protein [Klebsiella pasteurii]MDD9665723.1 fimbrial protein [Klebsiella pasteurii]MDD9671197.1 fimbrial protein [Klebsiella pasteurii]MDD9687314.1 fimbrial protein [Klebsiella pasteurii]
MKIKLILFFFITLSLSNNAWSFSCKTARGSTVPIGGGSDIVLVTLTPELQQGQNLVVDLSSQIFCRNDYPADYIDYVTLSSGSAYQGVLTNFSGTVNYNGMSYPFPTTSETSRIVYNSKNYSGWPVKLYLTPTNTAGGVVIKAGTEIATLNLRQKNNKNSDDFTFQWRIFSINDVTVPTGSCDVSSRNINITLPNYPQSATIPLNIHCTKNQSVGFYLTGNTIDAANSIFKNTASSSPADGVGIKITRDGISLPVNTIVKLGNVTTTPLSLGLQANYERVGGGITAGNVQSIVGVNFVYQ